jgi:hypothetical protein
MYYGLLVIAWALQVAWIARAAQDHGRSVAFWIIVGGGLGIAGLVVAKMLVTASAQPFGGNTLMYVTFVAPLGLMTIPMASVAVALTKAPTYAARRAVWKVHAAKRGSGTLAIGRDRIAIAWSDGRDEIELGQLTQVVPDGECLRLTWADRELVVMPMEKPDTRPGRQAQARALASQIAAFRRRS